MSEWVEVKLGQVIEIIGGGTPKTTNSAYWNGSIPWLSVVDFNTGSKYVSVTEKSITELGLNKSSTNILNVGDIIISARGTVGALAVLKREMAFNQSCYGIRSKKEVSSSDYIYYLLKDTINDLKQISHGGVFDTITRSTFDEINILLPPLPEQQAIASVLSALDDKIDLLQRQNQTLEQMAATLFRQWFIEEAKEDWEDGCLGDIATNIRINADTQSIQDNEIYIGLEHIERRNIALSNHGYGSDVASNKSRFMKTDVLFGKLRPYFHKVCMAPFNGVCSTDILVLRAKQPAFKSFILFAFFQDDVVAFANLTSGGTRMPRADWKTLSEYPIAIPPMEKVLEFEALANPSISKIFDNLKQIQTLQTLRDTLLPKLISGEVRLKGFETLSEA